MARRRRSLLALLVTLVVAAVLTGRAYDARPGSDRLLTLTLVIARVLVAGAVVSGGMPRPHRSEARPFVAPFLTGVALFAAFAVGAWVSRLFPPLHHAVVSARLHGKGSGWMTAAAVTAAVAEEAFYRGALFERVRLPIWTTSFLHALTTLPTGNVALAGAAFALGGVCGLSRRASGGWWSPAVVHVTWLLLCLWLLPA